MLNIFIFLAYVFTSLEVSAQNADQVLFGSTAREYLIAATTSGDVAAQAAYSQDDLVQRLDLDADLGYDRFANNWIYACNGVAEAGLQVATAIDADTTPDGNLSSPYLVDDIAAAPSSLSGPGASEPPPSLSSTFRLHSRPSSRSKIYLDFDGHNTVNSAWNKNRASVLVTPPYSLDSDPAFSTADLQAVTGKPYTRGHCYARHECIADKNIYAWLMLILVCQGCNQDDSKD